MVESDKPILWIVGDSFSYIDQQDFCNQIWPILIPSAIGYDLHNDSMPGTAQDWAWRKIRDWQFRIRPIDQLVVVLTHPSRYWFFEDMPDVSNHNLVDFDQIVNDKDKVRAALSFIQHIQRPELDIQTVDHRMGWLSNLVYKNNWKKPIIIAAFAQTIYTDLYPNLIFSKGNLFVVNKEEEVNNVKDKNWDTRYNHLCLSNHKILAEKIANTITTGCELDLTTGFIDKIYRQELLDDPEQKELSPLRVKHYQEKSGSLESWLTRFKSK